jgi:hypothetical protein
MTDASGKSLFGTHQLPARLITDDGTSVTVVAMWEVLGGEVHSIDVQLDATYDEAPVTIYRSEAAILVPLLQGMVDGRLRCTKGADCPECEGERTKPGADETCRVCQVRCLDQCEECDADLFCDSCHGSGKADFLTLHAPEPVLAPVRRRTVALGEARYPLFMAEPAGDGLTANLIEVTGAPDAAAVGGVC